MKWHTIITTALSASQLWGAATAVSTCSTYYGTSATTKVPTTTITTTVTYTYSTVVTTVTRTTTEPIHTFTKTVGKTTTTIPTGPSFTPIISAGALPGVSIPKDRTVAPGRRAHDLRPRAPHPRNAKALREAAAAAKSSSSTSPATTNTHWPQRVVCTHTTSTTAYATRPFSTAVRSATTGRYATSTTSVATATAYAACEGDRNVVSAFHGRALKGVNYNKHYQICGFGGGDSGTTPSGAHSGEYPCMDARACCEVAYDWFSGWRFDNATGYNRCIVMLGNDVGYSGGWVFYDGENHGEYFFGNAASRGGVYGGTNPDPDCTGGEGGCS